MHIVDIKVSMNVDFVFNYLRIYWIFFFIFIAIAGSEGLISVDTFCVRRHELSKRP